MKDQVSTQEGIPQNRHNYQERPISGHPLGSSNGNSSIAGEEAASQISCSQAIKGFKGENQHLELGLELN